jgi:hypothetical protein
MVPISTMAPDLLDEYVKVRDDLIEYRPEIDHAKRPRLREDARERQQSTEKIGHPDRGASDPIEV